MGAIMDARVADYMLFGLRTLEERMQIKRKNAATIVKFLQHNLWVKKVYWSGSDLLSFELVGDLEISKKVVESFQFILMAPHLGDDYPLGIHPASTTHVKVPQEKRLDLGISDTLIRLSPGLLDPRDVISDIKQAFIKTFN